MSAVSIAVLSLGGIVLLMVLKQTGGVYTVIAQCSLVIVILLAIFPEIKELFGVLEGFAEYEFLKSTSVKTIFKAFGVLTVGSVASDICRDNGENAVAGVVELSVKILAISCALPMVTAVVEIAQAFFN